MPVCSFLSLFFISSLFFFVCLFLWFFLGGVVVVVFGGVWLWFGEFSLSGVILFLCVSLFVCFS